MDRILKIIYQKHLIQFFLSLILFVSSCSQNNPGKPAVPENKNILKPPVTITIKSPIITRLDTCPSPLTITIPENKKDSFSLKINNSKRVVHFPEIKPADFFVPMQNYNTSNGLPLNGLISSCIDRKGNLWFGTQGGGVSRYDGKSFMNYTIEQGLASSNVFSIFEDKKGNLWFGTMSGVSCYNGKSFTNYTTTQGLVNNNVLSILEDRNGNLWFGTRGGASRLNNDEKSMANGKAGFTNFTTADGLAGNSITCILKDKDDNIWFGTLENGVSRYDGKSFMNYSTEQGLANNLVRSAVEDKNGNLWFGTLNGISCYNARLNDEVGHGKYFINYTTEQGLADNNVLSILNDKSGNLWFGTPRGASLYNGRSLPDDKACFINYTILNGMSNSPIMSIIEDKSGDIWFSTLNGLSRLDRDWKILPGGRTGFTSYATVPGLANNSVTSILLDRKGDFWLGTLGAGVFRLNKNGNTFTTYTTAQGLANNFVRSIIEDRKGNLWFATDGGVSRLDKDWKYFTNYTTEQGLGNNYVRCVINDNEGNLWFGTFGGGVSCLDRQWKTFTTYTTAQGLAHNVVRNLIQDKKGNLWFSTLGGGVSRLDKDWKYFTNYTTANGLVTDYIWNLFEDSSGNLWFCTEVGVSRFDGKSFLNYTTAEGMGDNGVGDIVMDKKGTIWIGTNNGFTALKSFAQDAENTSDSSRKNLQPANPLPNYELISSHFNPVFEIYNIKTGYPVNDINMNGLFITGEDIIWAGSTDKLIRFDYNSLNKNPNPPNVFIQGIKIDNESICWYDLTRDPEKTDSITTPPNILEEITLFGKVLDKAEIDIRRKRFSDIKFDGITPFYPIPVNLVLPYRHNNIIFDYAAIEPARPNLVRYQYILEGYDKVWSPVNGQTSATFGNMPEGTYTFKLKAQSPDGVWSEPLSYTFKVLPSWYRAWWAYMLYIVVFLTASWFFIKWRERTLKKEKILLEKKIANRTHELKEEKEKVETTLTDLKATQAQLIQSEKMASLGQLIAGIAHEINTPLGAIKASVGTIIDSSNESLKQLPELVKKLSDSEFALFLDLVNRSVQNNIHITSKEEREHRKYLTAEIEKHGIENADNFADLLVDMAIYDNIEPYLPIINEQSMQAAFHLSQQMKNSQNIKTAVERASKIVFALKNYARFSNTEDMVLADIPETIETVLTLYHNQLKLGINVVKEFEEVSRILCYPDELNQVWTNLIYNSVQAMDGKGVLTISVSKSQTGFENQSGLVIRITDTGKGIPSEIKSKIFDAFYTTKSAGEGSGLGLYIVKQIIDKHKGKVRVESEAGKGSTFIIELPGTKI